MRPPLISLFAAAAFLTGCQTSSAEAEASPQLGPYAGAQAIDAWLLGKPRVAEATFSSDAPTIAPQGVTGELLAAAIRCIEEQAGVVSANIAHAQTVAYKRRAAHVTTSAVEIDGQRYQVPIVAGVDTVYTAGVITVTDRALDLAIDGEGLFEVLLPDGTSGYTRDGSFQLNAEGKLVTSAGYVLTPEITVPQDVLEIWIDPEGRVSGRTASAPDAQTQFGQINLTRFLNPSGLTSRGSNISIAHPAAGAPVVAPPGTQGAGLLKQGFIERSNVQIVNELVNLIVAQRAYEVNSRAIQASDQMLSTATNLSR